MSYIAIVVCHFKVGPYQLYRSSWMISSILRAADSKGTHADKSAVWQHISGSYLVRNLTTRIECR